MTTETFEIADIKSGLELAILEDTSRVVVFTTAFSGTPNVVVSLADSKNEDSLVQAHSFSSTEFIIMLLKGKQAATTRNVCWVATTAGNP